jgi:uncharacterized membrane protein
MPDPLPLIGVYDGHNETMTRDVFPLLSHFNYPFRAYHRDDLAALNPGDVALLLMPGGWYFFDKQPDTAARIRAFVAAGGGYVGICCGAINAVKLGLLNADLVSMGGLGPVDIEPVDGDHPVLKGVARKSEKAWRAYDKFTMLRYNGWPMFLKEGARMIAAYDMDKAVAAIACADYGQGRVVAFSPHPEGATCAPGIFRDRDKHPMVYDGIAMGTAPLLDNAIQWCLRRS